MFSVPNYPEITGEEYNPLSGSIQRAMALYQNAVKTAYSRPTAEQALQKAILENKQSQQNLEWNPKRWQSEIGLQGAESALYGQQAKFYPQVTQSEINLRTAQAIAANTEAQMNQVKLNYIKQATGAGQQAQQPEMQAPSAMPAPAPTQSISLALKPPTGAQQPMGTMQPGSAAPVSGNAISSAMTGAQQPSINAAPMNVGTPSSPTQNQAISNAMQQPAQQAQQMAPSPAPMAQTNRAPATQQNVAYGVPTPMPTQDDNVNKMIFGIDTYSPKLTTAVEQQAAQRKLYQDDISAASQRANKALENKSYLSLFNNAMDRSRYKGNVWGNVPSSGLSTAFLGDMSPEQEADRAASKLLIGGIGELTDVMGKAHFSNIDMKAAQAPKFTRTMTKENRQIATDFQNGINARMQEEPKFYTAISSDPRTAPPKNIADIAWRNYQEEFPLTKETKNGFSYQGSNSLNKWPIFTTPKAIDSIQRNGFYKPTQAERNATYMLLPDRSGQYHIMPIAKNKVGDAVTKHGAMPL